MVFLGHILLKERCESGRVTSQSDANVHNNNYFKICTSNSRCTVRLTLKPGINRDSVVKGLTLKLFLPTGKEFLVVGFTIISFVA